MTPFADDDATLSLENLTVDNGREAITISGEMRISRDRRGLELARRLKTIVDSAVTSLEDVGDLPDRLADEPERGDAVPNPFA